ncbi:MAG: hypothetical protein NQU41_02445 [Candidatus Methanosuratincola sp.]|jgi:hypothetical protein|uniref:Uncharacterized protein n=2 Tax=Candidatus Methanosuratincola (ex Vanwonterghem et al. 2016) TaxID=1915412 RepID=A0A7J3V0S4_9CREN|nr:hypothetical protein [Candidatus Methanosuratincola sp.]RWX73729.1 MAG: hypothetical protein Metus_0508 [Candidatus Methanosuratincola subterraneus]
MLQEIEELLIETLRKNLKGVPGDQVGALDRIKGTPSVGVSCGGFKFGAQQAVDSEGSKTAEISEVLELKRDEARKRLKNKPEGGSLEVQVLERKGHESGKESWTKIAEGEGYTVDYKAGIIEFRQPVWKAMISYRTRADVLRRALKLISKYFIDIRGGDSQKTDSLAEEVVKVLLAESDAFERRGIGIRPLKGIRLEDGLRIVCIAEKEISVEFEVGVIERIEIGKGKVG